MQQKYSAELIMCGSDLSTMTAVTTSSSQMKLLLLAGVDGSLCVRRVILRPDGKMNCVLLYYSESVTGDMACPITSVQYNAATDSVLVGDASCTVWLIEKITDQLSNAARLGPQGKLATTEEGVRPVASGSGIADASSRSLEIAPPAEALAVPAAAPAAVSSGEARGDGDDAVAFPVFQ